MSTLNVTQAQRQRAATRRTPRNCLFGLMLLLAYAGAANAKLDRIYPSGDTTGELDQLAIQAALDAAGSEKSANIRLERGTFYIRGGVSATGFQGMLQGAGQDKTKVIAVGEGRLENRGSVFLFVDGQPAIRDFAIDVPDGSSYLDSNPRLFVSDGGAALDIYGGGASIERMSISANGPFNDFGMDSLETGVLLHNCDADFELKNSDFNNTKRTFVFKPEEASSCNVDVRDNQFYANRTPISLLGGDNGDFGGNDGKVTVRNNYFGDSLTGDIYGGLLDYAVDITSNRMERPDGDGNSSIQMVTGSGALVIRNNGMSGTWFLGSILIEGFTGGVEISRNKIEGGAVLPFAGPIAIVASDNVLIEKNNLRSNTNIPGWSLPGFETRGAYTLVDSTNVRVSKESLPGDSSSTCQVLQIPAIDPDNMIDPALVTC